MKLCVSRVAPAPPPVGLPLLQLWKGIADPETHTTTYTYDPVGRVTSILRPDSSSLGFSYDLNGNMKVLTNPAVVDHGFGYNGVNLSSSYDTHLSGSYAYHYDRDRRLSSIDYPSGKQLRNIYENGRFTHVETPEGNTDFSYLCSSKVGSISRGGETLAYGYDGPLVISATSSGTLNQPLTYTYNTDFRPQSFVYAGGSVAYVYDNDGLLTKAGDFTITRDTSNGLPTSVTGGVLNETRGFNGYGELSASELTLKGANRYSWNLTRGDSGRIVNRNETIDGTTTQLAYTYDPDGARTSETNTLRSISRQSTYDDEDHILTAGDTAYEYDLDGFLTTKTRGSEITRYTYASRGELLSVTLPDGKLIEYAHDPLGRRIAKKINGTITEKYLWQGMTQLLAVYDGSNNLIQRFQYADSRMPVAMTQSGSTYYLGYDPVGTPRIVADSTGTVVKCLNYDSFGNLLSDSNPTFKLPFGFAGGFYDPDTSLVRFGYRDYDPNTGRWTAKDPIGFEGSDTNLYGYCLADPVNLVDPEGLVFWPKVIQKITEWLSKKLTKPVTPEEIIKELVDKEIQELKQEFPCGPGNDERTRQLEDLKKYLDEEGFVVSIGCSETAFK